MDARRTQLHQINFKLCSKALIKPMVRILYLHFTKSLASSYIYKPCLWNTEIHPSLILSPLVCPKAEIQRLWFKIIVQNH